MSMKLYDINFGTYLVAENQEMAREMFEVRYPECIEIHINEIDFVDGYKIIPIGKNINDVLDKIALSYLMDHSG